MTIMKIQRKTQLGYISITEHTTLVYTNQVVILTELTETISVVNEDFIPPSDMNGMMPWANESNVRLCSILINQIDKYINLN